jgi:hypothetical protein
VGDDRQGPGEGRVEGFGARGSECEVVCLGGVGVYLRADLSSHSLTAPERSGLVSVLGEGG